MSDAVRTWEVLETSGLVLVQDDGRPGLAHLGVPRAGWLDAPAARLAGRLLGDGGAAVLEIALGTLVLRPDHDTWVALTGAPAPLTVDGRAVAHGAPMRVPAGAVLSVGPPPTGVRAYLALAGGVAVEPVLGSRSTDTLAWVGPPPVEAGQVLPVGTPGTPRAVDAAPLRTPSALRVVAGPRADWFAPDVLDRLCATAWTVGASSNRVGMRLDGEPLARVRDGELASEGVVLGAVQVPPDGRPVVFLADHPTTGGYPVVAVVRADDLALCAQRRPGETVRFTRSA